MNSNTFMYYVHTIPKQGQGPETIVSYGVTLVLWCNNYEIPDAMLVISLDYHRVLT